MQFNEEFYENWNDHNVTSSQIDEDESGGVHQNNGFGRLKDTPGRRKTKGGGNSGYLMRKRDDQLGTSDEEEYSVYERQHQLHLNQQSRKLLEAGLNIDHTYSNNNNNDTTYR